MIVLGIETATHAGSVALVDETHQLALRELGILRTHSEWLLGAIRDVLGDAGCTIKEVHGIAVSLGPGSFTGLRIGLSTAKGLCYANDLPLAGVSTLDAMASRFPFCRVPVCPMLDARKREVYAALYDMEAEQPVRLIEPEAAHPVRFLESVGGTTLFLGSGAALYRQHILDRLGDGALFAPAELFHPSAAAVARLGLGMLKQGQRVDVNAIEPTYLRVSEAQLARRG